ncbi:hypothetical protein CLCR_07472 [Cladophialophora carrionii]|uniref:Gfd2/YDR514C-like C-terminal domain-containing protein n=1 Tax=Cladophialophora carrionii TaxID=86049 RepID=A0A1C1CNB3_9EURO|nr:hypothetical protein CLCR_07472 [Cladophialophora carrionii]
MAATTTNAPGWAFGNAVLVAIDIEIHCRKHYPKVGSPQDRVSEIGVASFDPRRVRFADAGDRAKNTWSSIKACNFAVTENTHIPGVGSHARHCQDRQWLLGANAGVKATDFDFGSLYNVSRFHVKKAFVNKIRTLLGDHPPYNNDTPYHNNREVVFLFFDQQNDLRWLQGLGIDLSTEFPNSRIIDIQRGPLAAAIGERMRGKAKISAEDMYKYLRFETVHMHNGGNDAVWELRAYLAELTLTDPQTHETRIPDEATTLNKDGVVVKEEPTYIAAPEVMVDGEVWEL